MVAVDDVFVVPLPSIVKIVGLFHAGAGAGAGAGSAIAANAREDVARRIGNAAAGWNAVAVGDAGQPGLALEAASEQDAISGALTECGRRDHACRVIAIGPFTVEPR